MQQDAQGLDISTTSGPARDAWNHFVTGFLLYRADVAQRLAAMREADPECGLFAAIQAGATLMAFSRTLLPAATRAAAEATRLTEGATLRERLHAQAVAHWAAGDLDAALAAWERILDRHPTDIIAIKFAHFLYFWLGRHGDMAASIERVMPAWSPDLPGYGPLLACRCFAQEEIGNHLAAEPWGRRAIEIEPRDLWAAHAVAHVMEMQGRRAEGIAWLDGLAPHWAGGNNLMHHLAWHRALFHLEQRDFDRVLDLYDHGFRNLASPLVQAMPDLYIDIQNAAAILFRLQRQGIAVGDRWEELADHAEARIGDTLSAFTLPHWMLALAATGRTGAADRLLAAIRAAATAPGTLAPILREAALPICEAIRADDPRDTIRLMRPALGGMHRLGGSAAQQDVLEQVFLDAALRADAEADIRLILERVAGRRPIPPSRSIGWREAARRFTEAP